MEIKEILKSTKAYVWNEMFAVAKVKNIPKISDFFSIIKDRNEITLILKEKQIDEIKAIEVEKGFRIITFDTILPFNLVGFISAISNALAKKGISILTVSSYSTDHILVKDEDLNKTIETLKEIGVEIKSSVR
jgi:hypothetical protein